MAGNRFLDRVAGNDLDARPLQHSFHTAGQSTDHTTLARDHGRHVELNRAEPDAERGGLRAFVI